MTKGTIPFLKMHGAGNDFVVIDNRSGAVLLREDERKHLADRHFGIGCDQVVMLEKADSPADVFMRLYNQDGGEVSACGNATRCVAWLVMQETGKTRVRVQTRAGLLLGEAAGEKQVTVDMGTPHFDWRTIPLSHEMNAQEVPFIRLGALFEAFCVNMGNPHAVFFVPEVAKVDLAQNGPKVEHHSYFPERTNVEVVEVVSRSHIKVRVWERGTGETLACGTGACAAAVAARVKGLVDETVTVSLPGGDLIIEWAGKTVKDVQSVRMTGPVEVVFEGIYKQ